MMNIIKSMIYIEVIFSDDEQYCYLFKKIWDEKKVVCIVIMMYFYLDGVLLFDFIIVFIFN